MPQGRRPRCIRNEPKFTPGPNPISRTWPCANGRMHRRTSWIGFGFPDRQRNGLRLPAVYPGWPAVRGNDSSGAQKSTGAMNHAMCEQTIVPGSTTEADRYSGARTTNFFRRVYHGREPPALRYSVGLMNGDKENTRIRLAFWRWMCRIFQAMDGPEMVV